MIRALPVALGKIAGFLGVDGQGIDVTDNDPIALPGYQTQDFESVEGAIQGRACRAELGGELALAAADRDLALSGLGALLLLGAGEEPGGETTGHVEPDRGDVADVSGADHAGQGAQQPFHDSRLAAQKGQEGRAGDEPDRDRPLRGNRGIPRRAVEQGQLSQSGRGLDDGEDDFDAGGGEARDAELSFFEHEERVARIAFIPQDLAGRVAPHTRLACQLVEGGIGKTGKEGYIGEPM